MNTPFKMTEDKFVSVSLQTVQMFEEDTRRALSEDFMLKLPTRARELYRAIDALLANTPENCLSFSGTMILQAISGSIGTATFSPDCKGLVAGALVFQDSKNKKQLSELNLETEIESLWEEYKGEV